MILQEINGSITSNEFRMIDDIEQEADIGLNSSLP